MTYTTEQLEDFIKLIKNITIKDCKQGEYTRMLDALYNAVFTKEVFPQRSTYVNEEHNVRADS